MAEVAEVADIKETCINCNRNILKQSHQLILFPYMGQPTTSNRIVLLNFVGQVRIISRLHCLNFALKYRQLVMVGKVMVSLPVLKVHILVEPQVQKLVELLELVELLVLWLLDW